MDVKCPRCNKIALLDDDMRYVKCECGYNAVYDEYIEEMKNRALSLVDEFIDRISYQ